MQTQNYQKNSIAKKAESYLKENEGLLRKYKLTFRLVVNFAKRRNPPLLSKLALWIVAKQGGILDIQFGETVKK